MRKNLAVAVASTFHMVAFNIIRFPEEEVRAGMAAVSLPKPGRPLRMSKPCYPCLLPENAIPTAFPL